MSPPSSLPFFHRCIKAPTRHGVRAFTLLEALLVLALSAGAAMLAMPSLHHWLMRWRVDATVQALLTAMAYARIESVWRGGSVTLCRGAVSSGCSNTVRFCRGGSAHSNEWRCGWRVVVGHKKERVALSEAGALLRDFSTLPGVSIVASGNVNALSFSPPAGQASGTAGNIEVGPLHDTARSGRYSALKRCIRISMVGRPRVEANACR